jgi:hypothetical protein
LETLGDGGSAVKYVTWTLAACLALVLAASTATASARAARAPTPTERGAITRAVERAMGAPPDAAYPYRVGGIRVGTRNRGWARADVLGRRVQFERFTLRGRRSRWRVLGSMNTYCAPLRVRRELGIRHCY